MLVVSRCRSCSCGPCADCSRTAAAREPRGANRRTGLAARPTQTVSTDPQPTRKPRCTLAGRQDSPTPSLRIGRGTRLRSSPGRTRQRARQTVWPRRQRRVSACPSSACRIGVLVEPDHDLRPPVAHVLADPEAARSISSAAPLVDRGNRDREVVRQFLWRQQSLARRVREDLRSVAPGSSSLLGTQAAWIDGPAAGVSPTCACIEGLSPSAVRL